jgi:hypothetical protein
LCRLCALHWQTAKNKKNISPSKQNKTKQNKTKQKYPGWDAMRWCVSFSVLLGASAPHFTRTAAKNEKRAPGRRRNSQKTADAGVAAAARRRTSTKHQPAKPAVPPNTKQHNNTPERQTHWPSRPPLMMCVCLVLCRRTPFAPADDAAHCVAADQNSTKHKPTKTAAKPHQPIDECRQQTDAQQAIQLQKVVWAIVPRCMNKQTNTETERQDRHHQQERKGKENLLNPSSACS